MAFLRSFGPLGFEIHIFCCYTLCLVYLAWQRARQPISATRDFSVQKPEVSGRISSGLFRGRTPNYCWVCTELYVYSIESTEWPTIMMLLEESSRSGSQMPSTFL